MSKELEKVLEILKLHAESIDLLSNERSVCHRVHQKIDRDLTKLEKDLDHMHSEFIAHLEVPTQLGVEKQQEHTCGECLHYLNEKGWCRNKSRGMYPSSSCTRFTPKKPTCPDCGKEMSPSGEHVCPPKDEPEYCSCEDWKPGKVFEVDDIKNPICAKCNKPIGIVSQEPEYCCEWFEKMVKGGFIHNAGSYYETLIGHVSNEEDKGQLHSLTAIKFCLNCGLEVKP